MVWLPICWECIPDLAKTLAIALVAGSVGCFVDSILGAMLEIKGYLNNEHVNLLATLTGALLGNVMVWLLW